MIVLRDIEFESHCEHHMAPIIGRAHVGYLPTARSSASASSRASSTATRRFQVQEKMTAQIANCIDSVLQPRGVGVVIDASHQCMTTRGVHKAASRWSPADARRVPRGRAHARRVPAIHRGGSGWQRRDATASEFNSCIGQSPNMAVGSEVAAHSRV